MPKRYVLSDGKLRLTIEESGAGRFTVTAPLDPGLVSQGRSLKEVFAMARDALDQLWKADVVIRRELPASRRKSRR
ncbi:MAG: type II toxin-antitoxin system HicB family antitoxin [Planctomycetes bacterium]|nr:type II toxin-antitoxin system HicB family antitoxin [Planctomycetota bacterium]